MEKTSSSKILKTVQIEISKVSNDPANVRTHSKKNIDAIRASLKRFGQQKPIVIDSDNIVRAGNGTLEAAKELGWKYISVVISDLEPSELTAYAIADNRTAELADWDLEDLDKQLQSLESDLATVAYDDFEYAPDINEVEAPVLPDGDKPPFEQMTFTLHDEQAVIVKDAMGKAAGLGPFGGENQNKNGNAIARVAEIFLLKV